MLLLQIFLSAGRQTPADVKSQVLTLPLWTPHVGIILSSRLIGLSASLIYFLIHLLVHLCMFHRVFIHSSTKQIFIECQLWAGDTEGRKKAWPPSHEGDKYWVLQWLREGTQSRCWGQEGCFTCTTPSASFSRQRDGWALSTISTSYPWNQAPVSGKWKSHPLATPSSPPPPLSKLSPTFNFLKNTVFCVDL